MESIRHFILVSFAVIVSFFGIQANTPPGAPLQVANQNTGIASTSQNGSFVYRNEEYGYSLIFPSTWKGLRVKKEKDWISFGIEDQDNLFSISAVPLEQWRAAVRDNEVNGTPIGDKLDENNQYAFIYSLSQDTTVKAAPFREGIQSIIKSFSLIFPVDETQYNSQQNKFLDKIKDSNLVYRDGNTVAAWVDNPKGGKCLSLYDTKTLTALNANDPFICDAIQSVLKTGDYVIAVGRTSVNFYKKGSRSISVLHNSQLPTGSQQTYFSFESGLDFKTNSSFDTNSKELKISLFKVSDSVSLDQDDNVKIGEKIFILP